MSAQNLLDMNSDWDYQLKMSKITTIELILRYRFPDMRLGFLYGLALNELDEIIDQISSITEEELTSYILKGMEAITKESK
jgi:hypothetical protein